MIVTKVKIKKRHGVPKKSSLIENLSWGSITSGLLIGGCTPAGCGWGFGSGF